MNPIVTKRGKEARHHGPFHSCAGQDPLATGGHVLPGHGQWQVATEGLSVWRVKNARSRNRALRETAEVNLPSKSAVEDLASVREATPAFRGLGLSFAGEIERLLVE